MPSVNLSLSQRFVLCGSLCDAHGRMRPQKKTGCWSRSDLADLVEIAFLYHSPRLHADSLPELSAVSFTKNRGICHLKPKHDYPRSRRPIARVNLPNYQRSTGSKPHQSRSEEHQNVDSSTDTTTQVNVTDPLLSERESCSLNVTESTDSRLQSKPDIFKKRHSVSPYYNTPSTTSVLAPIDINEEKSKLISTHKKKRKKKQKKKHSDENDKESEPSRTDSCGAV